MDGRLTEAQRMAALAELPAWSLTEGREALSRSFHFADFNVAFGFMTRVAMFAERHDHHPEWSNIYNHVEVTLATHSVGGLSANDIQLAKFMDSVAAAIGAKNA